MRHVCKRNKIKCVQVDAPLTNFTRKVDQILLFISTDMNCSFIIKYINLVTRMQKLLFEQNIPSSKKCLAIIFTLHIFQSSY